MYVLEVGEGEDVVVEGSRTANDDKSSRWRRRRRSFCEGLKFLKTMVSTTGSSLDIKSSQEGKVKVDDEDGAGGRIVVVKDGDKPAASSV